MASTTELVVQAGARLQGPVWRKAMLENGLSEAEAEEISGDIAAHYPPWVESTFRACSATWSQDGSPTGSTSVAATS